MIWKFKIKDIYKINSKYLNLKKKDLSNGFRMS